MVIRKISIKDINAATYNPRIDLQPGDSDYEKLEKSISTFGLVEPLVWNEETKNLVGGHQRLKILRRAGFKEVEVSVVNLTLEKEKALNLALNKIQGNWDEEKLANLLKELKEIPDFDTSITGFDVPEISELLDEYTELPEDDFDFTATVENIKEPVTKRGDLIELGQHRILCADSSNIENLKLLMNEHKADLLNTDFPYNINYGGGDKPNPNTRPKRSRKWPQIYSDNMPQAEYEAWMKKILVNAKEYLKPGAAFYIWQGLRQIPPLCQSLIDLDFYVSCFICWLKESPAITYADYCYRTEQSLYGWLKGAPHYWAGKPGESNVWEVHRDSTKSYLHPTQKPTELSAKALKNSSKKGDIVLDLFLGSGSSLIACEGLGRRCFGLELSEVYCDAIAIRYISYIGKDKAPKNLAKRYLKEESNVRK